MRLNKTVNMSSLYSTTCHTVIYIDYYLKSIKVFIGNLFSAFQFQLLSLSPLISWLQILVVWFGRKSHCLYRVVVYIKTETDTLVVRRHWLCSAVNVRVLFWLYVAYKVTIKCLGVTRISWNIVTLFCWLICKYETNYTITPLTTIDASNSTKCFGNTRTANSVDHGIQYCPYLKFTNLKSNN